MADTLSPQLPFVGLIAPKTSIAWIIGSTARREWLRDPGPSPESRG